ncbi:MAG: DUF2255 family protein [Proteobacteria bacterium]|nr:DUF2255 family protein [Pseudomonadota bacterium]
MAEPRQRLAIPAILLTLGLACAAPRAAEQPLDWANTDRWSFHVVTEDADGGERVTRIWFAVVDGAGVIRTRRTTRWWGNLERGSALRVRMDGLDYPVAVALVTEPAERERADAAFAAKYGWQERAVIPDDRAASDDPYMRLTNLPD